jgi:coproporphyrinogen III oxidase-like Fe-S oxidoreductase
MLLKNSMRSLLTKRLTKTSRFVLENKVPLVSQKIQEIDALGLYLHIPFCRQICPYCPYNKVIYQPGVAERYAEVVIKEIGIYADLVGNRPVTSFYIGGGTPTTMLDRGLERILERIYAAFNMQCGIHLESHPNDLSKDNLNTIVALGVEHLSLGVEALQDHHLQRLHRPYTVTQVMKALERSVSMGFKCVNADLIFALPDQTMEEITQSGKTLMKVGVDQVAAYPLFVFPYTKWAQLAQSRQATRPSILKRRRMLAELERIFYQAGYERTSVWAFTRAGVPKYCSVSVPLYLGLGASGASYLKDVFYLNTFNVLEYIRSLEYGNLPIALSLALTEEAQMAGWIYWRIYETRLKKKDFQLRFGKDFDQAYGGTFKLLSRLGFLQDSGDEIVLTDRGSYWLHALQDLFSIEYIARLWGTSIEEPWPQSVII